MNTFVEAFKVDINDPCLRPSELKGAARQQGDQPLHCVKDSSVEAFKANVDDSCLRPSEPKGVVRQQGDQPLVTHTRSF